MKPLALLLSIFWFVGVAHADATLTITLPDTYVARMVVALKANGGVLHSMTDAQAKRMILDIGLVRARQQTLSYEHMQAHIPVDAKLPPLDLPAQPK